jgi:hypothetical protein
MSDIIEGNDNYSPYCPVCTGCGEDGCCSALHCEQSENGMYCKTYLRDLKFGYLLSKDLYELISKDERYKENLDEIFDKNYKIIYE